VAAAEAAGVQIPAVLADVLYAMHGVERMHTTTLLARLTNMDEDAYAEFTPERLADELERVGVRRSGRQVKVDGVNLAGYRRTDLEAAVPAGATFPPGHHPRNPLQTVASSGAKALPHPPLDPLYPHSPAAQRVAGAATPVDPQVTGPDQHGNGG
jgi:hypothetical protein